MIKISSKDDSRGELSSLSPFDREKVVSNLSGKNQGQLSPNMIFGMCNIWVILR